jgi:hypothetical protein
MIFWLLVMGATAYGTYKGVKGMTRRAFAKPASWAWALSPLFFFLFLFGVTYWLFKM